MKRKNLLKYLREQGCEFIREGGNHSWWGNPNQNQNKRSSVPRHSEINEGLARKYAKTS
ncbi:MAG: type II toxin-antitoxin system HicA family toxin, partial [Nitrospirae bacterium]|nr:type II toxin-antitoxin system HicA family toxin [Candidatus Troglogloeales bacterium]